MGIIAGIDYSLNGPAICVIDTEKEFLFKNCSFYFLTDIKKNATVFLNNIHGENFSEYNQDCERYDTISEWVMRVCVGCEQVALEGYAYNAQGRVFHIAENTGILKYKLWQNSIPVEIVPPSHVKKIATGKGNADKEGMYDAFLKETFISLKDIITPNRSGVVNPVSDLVDAYYICKILYYSMKEAA
jgi:Holliday junction resolvasome RuvABC endonuclease subunit